jgi:hypothetical protein
MAEKEPRVKVKEVPHATLWSDGSISLYMVRASYPNVLHRYQGGDDGSKAKFGIVGLIPKRKPWRQARELVEERIAALMKENKTSKMKSDNKFLRDGDDSGRDEYEKFWSINASESGKISVRHSKRDPATGKPRVLKPGVDDDVIYPGCWVNIVIRPWFMNHQKYGKKINAGLVAVQHCPIEKVREVWPNASDEAFGNQRISDDEIDEDFDNYAEDGDSNDDDDDD